MDKLPGLQGLFDDLNNYRIDRIISHWGPKLDKSRNFKAIVKAAEGGRYKPKAKALAGTTHNKAGDTVINWRGYTYRIDP